MRIQRLALATLTAAATALPLAASAHVGVDGAAHHAASFVQGFVHPFIGMDHLAAMVGVGLWSALAARGARDLLWAPLGFAAMLLAGALLGLGGLQVPGVEPMIAASLLVIGLLVATRLRLPGPVAAAAVGAFALFHGVAHGYELSGDSSAPLAVAGMVLATALLHVAGIAIGWTLRQRGTLLPRVAGGAVAVFGVALLTQVA
ncbi:HupE/UreJ family protein [Variovorax sp. J22R133]|uniref:HupE/UreJ family protein n=1 Tax=Variovorax brevis TaxID=3053503 RepID=UPI0025791B6C|nr:HupE/UreJ family protein [Variovorax sp. J22R133]MDM0114119.1 HupE/UreJ family protein [Variovorax sp. J22R133]